MNYLDEKNVLTINVNINLESKEKRIPNKIGYYLLRLIKMFLG